MSLTPEEMSGLEEFLRPIRIAVVATVGASGMPQLTPNWYAFIGGKLAVSTTKERFKYRNLARDPRLSVCVYSEPLAANYATITGTAEIMDDDSIWPITQSIVERYVRPDGVEARMGELRRQSRVIISLEPQRVVFRAY